MLATKLQVENNSDTAKLELYRLIGEGYKAMQDGRTSRIWSTGHRVLYLFWSLQSSSSAEISDGILQVSDKLADYPAKHPFVNDELLKRIGGRTVGSGRDATIIE